jgi:hypothetical protein
VPAQAGRIAWCGKQLYLILSGSSWLVMGLTRFVVGCLRAGRAGKGNYFQVGLVTSGNHCNAQGGV